MNKLTLRRIVGALEIQDEWMGVEGICWVRSWKELKLVGFVGNESENRITLYKPKGNKIYFDLSL